MPRRILVVDDEQSAVLFLKASLELEGHEVFVATTGKEAVTLATCFEPDLVLCDFLLREDDDGVDVVNKILVLLPDVEVVFVTAVPHEVYRKAGDLRMRAVLEKPIEVDQLLTVIESLSIAA